jgi:hypothetical protein
MGRADGPARNRGSVDLSGPEEPRGSSLTVPRRSLVGSGGKACEAAAGAGPWVAQLQTHVRDGAEGGSAEGSVCTRRLEGPAIDFEVLPAGRPSDHAASTRDSDAARSLSNRDTNRDKLPSDPRKGRPRSTSELAAGSPFPEEWAWEELNFRPHAYQACALTT